MTGLGSTLRRARALVGRSERIASRLRPRKGDGFTRAYAAHLANRVPLLYAIVFTNNAILAARFHGTAPDFLTIWLPLASTVPLALRAFYWTPRRVARRSTEQLRRDLHNLAVVGPGVAFACTAWALALYAYGDTPQRSLVHYIVGVTCFASILGLGQSPLAALRMAIVSLVPASLWFLVHDHPNAAAVCWVQSVVGVLLMLLTYGYHEDFVALEEARQATQNREEEAMHMADRMRDLASHDPLTGVANRRAILETLEHALQDPSQLSPWLALLDLDGFKFVNDTYGHAAGDAVLKRTAERIGALPDVLSFGRLGGDEFAIVLAGDLAPADAIERLTGLIAEISKPVRFEGFHLAVTASVGLRLTERLSVHECLERADTALYEAKQRPGRVVQFTTETEAALRDRQAITRAFSSASLEDEISLVYQPIIDFDTGRIESYEALARWAPPSRPPVTPDIFVGLAENTGRIRELTGVVLRRALTECQVWNAGSTLNINLSVHDLVGDDAADRIHRATIEAGAPPAAIVLEVTETALMADMRRTADTLAQLRAHGFRIALDDFGTGQSSLARVHQLPLDGLKIDGSFAFGLDVDETRQAIAATIVALARQLRMGCTIEGIETSEQALAARALAIRSMQGFHFGRPVAASRAVAALQAA